MTTCRQSNDGTVCLRHLQDWPCPVIELLTQLRCAAVELAAPYGDVHSALGHIERSIELAEQIARITTEFAGRPVR